MSTKIVGNWLTEYDPGGSCTIVRLHPNKDVEEEIARIWHQRYEDLLDLQYAIGAVIEDMEKRHEFQMQDRYASKIREAHRDNK